MHGPAAIDCDQPRHCHRPRPPCALPCANRQQCELGGGQHEPQPNVGGALPPIDGLACARVKCQRSEEELFDALLCPSKGLKLVGGESG
eukprot:2684847-Prymnesium_polylepis.1